MSADAATNSPPLESGPVALYANKLRTMITDN
jgi:hypothetical protein